MSMTIIRHMGNLVTIYPIYIATGEILAVDYRDKQTIVKIFNNEQELKRAEEAKYYNG